MGIPNLPLEIADVHALSSFEMIVSGTVLLSLPLTQKYLMPHLDSSYTVDMLVSKSSLLALFMGLGFISVAPDRACYVLSLTVYMLATPMAGSLRSFSTGLLGWEGGGRDVVFGELEWWRRLGRYGLEETMGTEGIGEGRGPEEV